MSQVQLKYSVVKNFKADIVIPNTIQETGIAVDNVDIVNNTFPKVALIKISLNNSVAYWTQPGSSDLDEGLWDGITNGYYVIGANDLTLKYDGAGYMLPGYNDIAGIDEFGFHNPDGVASAWTGVYKGVAEGKAWNKSPGYGSGGVAAGSYTAGSGSYPKGETHIDFPLRNTAYDPGRGKFYPNYSSNDMRIWGPNLDLVQPAIDGVTSEFFSAGSSDWFNPVYADPWTKYRRFKQIGSSNFGSDHPWRSRIDDILMFNSVGADGSPISGSTTALQGNEVYVFVIFKDTNTLDASIDSDTTIEIPIVGRPKFVEHGFEYQNGFSSQWRKKISIRSKLSVDIKYKESDNITITPPIYVTAMQNR
jgi:hypothetical protein